MLRKTLKEALIEKPALDNEEIKIFSDSVKMFRGVFMRDTLPKIPWENEIGYVNLDSVENLGTHWVLYYKNNEKCYYFDSFGHGPPRELYTYLKRDIMYSTFILQDVGTSYCGHLCLILFKKLVESNDFITSLLYFVND